MGDVDIALRHVTTRHPEDIARRFVPPGEIIESMRWLDTQVASRERRLDKCLVVQLTGHRLAIHVEWFIDDDPDRDWRMFEYAYDLQAALRAEDAARYDAAVKRKREDEHAPEPVKPDRVYVRSCAVMLDGAAAPQPTSASWTWSEPACVPDDVCVMRYRVEAVYQRSTAELLAQPGMLWLVFAPLATDASEDNLRLAVQHAKERAQSREELDDVASAMHVVAVARPREHNLARRILDMFKDEGIIERTWPYQVGLEKGIEKGRVEGIEKGIEKGVERGAESLRGALLGILAARGLRVTPVQRKRIADMHALDTLVTWVERAATAKTTGAIFVDDAATKPMRTRRA